MCLGRYNTCLHDSAVLPTCTAYVYRTAVIVTSAWPLVCRPPEAKALQELVLGVLCTVAARSPSCGQQIVAAEPGVARTLSAHLQSCSRTLHNRGASQEEVGPALRVLCPGTAQRRDGAWERGTGSTHRPHSAACSCCSMQVTRASRLRSDALTLLCELLNHAEHAAERAAQLCAEAGLLQAALEATTPSEVADPRQAEVSLLGLRALRLIMG